jgi:hypothetical protein
MTREEIVKSMSVQDAIEVLKDTNTYGTADIAKSVAIDTMNKYHKIESLINSWELGLVDNIGYEIREVIEDGNNNL